MHNKTAKIYRVSALLLCNIPSCVSVLLMIICNYNKTTVTESTAG